MTTALLETLTSTEVTLAQHSQLIGAVLEGQEGASATVKVNGVAVTYPVTLSESDTLRIERPVGEIVTRLYGQPGPNAGTGPKGEPGTAATVTVGTVTTGAAGTQAQVTNSGTTSAAVLNFTIPKGADGAGGSGAVSSVAGRTGDITLTKADVGLGNVTNDAQVKRSEMGVASGVATLDADGKVPAAQLPAGTGGTLDTEAVQDIVGAMVKAGSNATITYDDAANTLTIGATGGGFTGVKHDGTLAGDGTPANPLSVIVSGTSGAILSTVMAPAYGEWSNDPSYYSSGGGSWEFEHHIYASSAFTLGGYDLAGRSSTPITLTVYASDSTWALGDILATSTTPSSNNDVLTWTLPKLDVAAGQYLIFRPSSPTTYLVGRRYTGGGSTTTAVSSDFVKSFWRTLSNGDAAEYRYYGRVRLPDQIKNTLNPLDPADFPISTPAAAPNKSGFMVVDDAAKTASLYWKFSDGTTKKLDLT